MMGGFGRAIVGLHTGFVPEMSVQPQAWRPTTGLCMLRHSGGVLIDLGRHGR
jgi:hypothetical protein